jgi:hypothetical protein
VVLRCLLCQIWCYGFSVAQNGLARSLSKTVCALCARASYVIIIYRCTRASQIPGSRAPIATRVDKMARIHHGRQFATSKYILTANRALCREQALDPATKGVDRVMSLFFGLHGVTAPRCDASLYIVPRAVARCVR